MAVDIIQIVLLLSILLVLLWRQREVVWSYKQSRAILDSCALIDGRVLELSKASFMPSQLIIPKFILDELQTLADGNDSHKRERARFGLEVASELQQQPNARVILDPYIEPGINSVDAQLLALAKKRRAKLYTTDFNLNKRAAVEGVTVLNVNELAQFMRPPALPGEKKTIKIIQKGSNPGQGVGYLEDGTMVVVDNAARRIGKNVEITITRVLQTAAGKMMFAVIKNK